MGQYHVLANLTKREYLHSHALGAGLKMIEQVGTYPGPGSALLILLACSNARGGGDLPDNPLVGRWTGDRIALVGDYAEDSDLEPGDQASLIYDFCKSPDELAARIEFLRGRATEQESQHPKAAKGLRDQADALEASEPYTNVTPQVAALLEEVLHFRYVGEGWKDIESDNRGFGERRMMAPDMLVISGDPPAEKSE